ncbi:Rieske (2Fe-2S) protein [Propionicicella superfundia]|uniref:Rieske (2Fe-2S) protein n=1 Tax=Propionicicella superfundia TaxID=348582 RepID=UPI000428A8AB|nr:Rieske (2Fe-2S) protein [Propionicicella superfundia]
MELLEPGGVSRRVVLSAGAAGALLIAAGCADTTQTSGAPATTTTPSADATGATSPSTGGNATSASAGSSPGVVATTDVPVGGGVILSADELVVTQPAAGTFVGLSTICPHQQCPVGSITDGKIICPCHNSEFDLTGAVLQGPATQALETRTITVANGQVYLG